MSELQNMVSVTVGDEYPREVTEAFLRYNLTRPFMFPLLALPLVLAQLIPIAVLGSGISWLSVVVGVGLGLAYIAFVVWNSRRNIHKSLAPIMPPNATYALQIGVDNLTIEGPPGRSEMAYELIREVRRHAGSTVALLILRSSKVVSIPAVLLDGGRLDLMRARIAEAKHPAAT